MTSTIEYGGRVYVVGREPFEIPVGEYDIAEAYQSEADIFVGDEVVTVTADDVREFRETGEPVKIPDPNRRVAPAGPDDPF